MLKVFCGSLIALLLLSGGTAHAYGHIGDPADELRVGQWLKGGPVSLAEGRGKNVYLIEFWASWCGWCDLAVPMLTYLQHHYGPRGLVVVGINVWENNTTDGPAYVQAQGDNMDYAVATDNSAHFCQNRYMGQFGIGYISSAFVVDKNGRFAYANRTVDQNTYQLRSDLLQVLEQTMPLTITGPGGAFVEVGQSHTLSVTQQGLIEPVTYQWRKNGVEILGATSSSYYIEACEPEDGGEYDCILTAAAPGDPVVTDAATLGVYPVGSLPVAGWPVAGLLGVLFVVTGSLSASRGHLLRRHRCAQSGIMSTK